MAASASKGVANSKVPRKRAADVSEQQPQKRVRQSPAPYILAHRESQRTPKIKGQITIACPSKRLNIYVFGEGSAGELGLGPTKSIDVKRPRLNTKLDAATVAVVDIATGGMHAVALTQDNKILTWGVNDNGALGRDTAWEGGLKDMDANDDDAASDDSEIELNPLESTPTAIPENKLPADTKFVQVTAGDSATFALTEHGQVYGWGTFVSNEGKAGFPTVSAQGVVEKQLEPMLMPGLKNIVQLSSGNNFCLALDSDGKVHSWGRSEQSQLGRRPVASRRGRGLASDGTAAEQLNDAGLIPGLVALPSRCRIVSIHAASDHAFAIDTKGLTYSWGLNNFAQTGVSVGAGKGGSTVFAPERVLSLQTKNMKMIQGGSHHSIGITHDGECLVWGRMDGAQMGLEVSKLPVDDPKKVVSQDSRPRILLEPTALPIKDCAYAAAGSDHNLLVTRQGKAYTWGFNANYQCGQGPDTDDVDVATMVDNNAVREQKLIWAGAGGQYSMLASYHEVTTANGTK